MLLLREILTGVETLVSWLVDKDFITQAEPRLRTGHGSSGHGTG